MPRNLQELYDDLRINQGPSSRTMTAVSTPDDPFIVKLRQLVLAHGVELKASDIHIEPTSSGARIRYRIDGLLHEMLQLPQEIRDQLIRSIKVKAELTTDTVGRSKPQDGRVDFESNGRTLDLRL